MSLASRFPSIKPSLLLDFANTKRLDPRVTFSRASSARYYDGVTVAKAEENLLTGSADFVTSWVAENVVVSANSATAPDGTLTAETITVAAGASSHRIRRTATVAAAGVVATYSVSLKEGTYNFVTLTLAGGSSNWVSATINLSTGAITQTGNGAGGTYVTSSVVAEAGGGYRLSVTGSGAGGLTAIWIDASESGTPTQGLWGQHSWTAAGTETFSICWGQLEHRAYATAYTPTTTQPITNYIPVLLTAGTDVCRFHHDPVTRECLGIYVEGAATNLLTYSEDFSNAAWATKDNVSIASNVVIAPDGTLTADKLVEDTSTNQHRVFRAIVGTSMAFSVYAKAAGRSFIGILSSAGTRTYFDLSNGTVVSVSAGSTAAIQHVGNGWYRCTLYNTHGTNGALLQLSPDGTTDSYAGDGYSGIYIWGAQLETGSVATSYIKTEASTVTRAADSAVVTGTNFSQWYNQSEGTLIGEAINPDTTVGNSAGIAAIKKTSQDAISIGLSPGTSGTANTVRTADVIQAVFFIASTAGELHKVAMAYTTNDVAISTDGAAASIDASATLPVVDALYIGENRVGQKLNGTIKSIAYYPKRLTDAQLQILTA